MGIKNKSYEIYKDLPPWAKGVTVIGLIGLGYLFVSQLIKKVKDEQEKMKMQEKLKSAKSELDILIANGMLSSYPKSQFNSWADTIQQQFDGCDFSTGCPLGCWVLSDMSNSGQVIYGIISKINNDRDFLELVDSFEIRTWDECGWGTGNAENKNLYEGMISELSNAELRFINTYLTNRGIKYNF